MREQLLTAVGRTLQGVEWTTLKGKQDDYEVVTQGAISLNLTDEEPVYVLPMELVENLRGDVFIPIRTSKLLLRVMELPTIEDHEITNMVELQIDKVSPFPADQLAISHEVLRKSEKTSTVLMVGVQRSRIDDIGDEYKEIGINIHGMDARVLGWIELLRTKEHLLTDGNSILLIDDGIDFTLIIIENGIPLIFRTLEKHHGIDLADELTHEIEYTLTAIETEFGAISVETMDYWTFEPISPGLQKILSDKCGLKVSMKNLSELPPLSQGTAQRAVKYGHQRIELIPKEWIEYKKFINLRRKFLITLSVIAGIWIVSMLGFWGVYRFEKHKLSIVRSNAAAIAGPAQEAAQIREKLNTLKQYSDRSFSALECLREITILLPSGDIELASYNYKKGKGISLRGTAANDNIVYEFYKKLGDSRFFTKMKDQNVTSKTTKGVRRSVFSVTLELPTTRGEEE